MSDKPLFVLIAEYHQSLGLLPMKDMPDKVWVRRVDDSWTLAVNASKTDAQVSPDGCMNVTLKPFHAVAWFNGWIAGIFTPYGGEFVNGEAGNEESFVAALEAATTSAPFPGETKP